MLSWNIPRQYQTRQMVAVIWDGNNNERYWCLCMYISAEEDGTHKIDHLENVIRNTTDWVRPCNDDIQNVHEIQILQVDVKGEWNLSKRAPTFTVSNKKEIEQIFQKYLS